MNRLKSILKTISSILFVEGILLLSFFFLALFFSEELAVLKGFLFAFVSSMSVALSLRILFNGHQVRLDFKSAMLLTPITWFFVSLFGAIPFMVALEMSFVDSFFESISGFTTTGITLIKGLDSLPYSILLFRSIMQWIGGLGILTFFLFITTNTESNLWQLFSSEGHKYQSARPYPNIYHTVKMFIGIYVVLTGINAMLLYGLGVSFKDALLHAFSTISTGGFSSHDASLAYYEQAGFKHFRLIEYVTIFFMMLGGINFYVHYKVIKEDRLFFFKEVESKAFLKFIGLFSVLIALGKFASGHVLEFEGTLRTILFQVVSIMTTTGFATTDIGSSYFPESARIIFLILMVIGGSIGSTSGGIKVLRIVILNRLIKREVRQLKYSRKAVHPVVINHSVIHVDEIKRVSGLFFAWVLLILIGTYLTTVFSSLDGMAALSGMASAVGNVGPFYFSIDQMIELSPIVKLIFIIGMLAGRLELLPMILIFSRKVWRD